MLEPLGSAADGVGQPLCAICDEPLTSEVALFPCGHFFCERCAKQHLAIQHACPTCRARVKPAAVFRCRHRRQQAARRGEDPALAHVSSHSLEGFHAAQQNASVKVSDQYRENGCKGVFCRVRHLRCMCATCT